MTFKKKLHKRFPPPLPFTSTIRLCELRHFLHLWAFAQAVAPVRRTLFCADLKLQLKFPLSENPSLTLTVWVKPPSLSAVSCIVMAPSQQSPQG